MLRRRRSKADDTGDLEAADELQTPEPEEERPVQDESSEDVEEEVFYYGAPPEPRPDGPWDVSELEDAHEGRVDLGGILVPGVDGMELRVEVTENIIVAATVILGQSAIQLQPFAAPRSEGIWSSVRREIAAGVTKQQGTVDEVEGPVGIELRARVPVKTPDGTQGIQLVRFIGCDGPRWFLRGVISGMGAVQPETAGLVEELFRGVVVVRGAEPMAPRDPITLRLPPDAQLPAEGAQPGTDDPVNPYTSADFDPMRRGPEITEIR